MNIGDLFFTFRGDGANLQVDAKTQGGKAGLALGSSMAANIKKSLGSSLSGENIGKGLVQGLGLAGGLGIANEVSKVTDIVGASIDAFREDQVSVQKLGTALRDNVKNWDGNTDAIERTIKARTALGFSDDDQRAGLATLVASTKDWVKALELEQGAMDIARARNIDLASATDAVAKAYGGNTKSLKTLIPGLNLGKNSTEALANAFKAVGGAASDFAKTDLGKVQVEEAKVNEAMEELGSVLSGPVADGASAAADALTAVLDALDALQGGGAQTSAITDSIKGLIDTHNLDGLRQAQAALQDATDKFKHPELVFAPETFNTLMGQLDQVNAGLDTVNRSLDHFQGTAVSVGDHSTDAIEKMRGAVVPALGDMADASNDWRKTFHDDSGKIIRDANKVRDTLAGDVQDEIDGYFGPLEKEEERHNQRLQLFADQEALRKAKTKEDSRTAAAAIVQDLDDEASSLVDLGKTGDLTQTDVQRFTKDAKANYASLGKDAQKHIDAIITKLNTLAGMPDIDIGFKITPTTALTKAALKAGFIGNQDLYKKGGNPFRAAGGPVSRGVPYVVGEDRPELFVPDMNGRIIPSVPATMPAAWAGAAAGDTNITVALPTRAAPDPFETADALRRLRDFGILR